VLKLLSSYLDELTKRNTLNIPAADTSSGLPVGMLKGNEHFRRLHGVQPGLNKAEKERIIGAAISLFIIRVWS